MTLLTLSILNLLTIALIVSLPVVSFFGIRHATRPLSRYDVDHSFEVVDHSTLGSPRFFVVGSQSGRIVSLPTADRSKAAATARTMNKRARVAR